VPASLEWSFLFKAMSELKQGRWLENIQRYS